MRINLAFDKVAAPNEYGAVKKHSATPNLVQTKGKRWVMHPESHLHLQTRVYRLHQVIYDEIAVSDLVNANVPWFYPIASFAVNPDTWMQRKDCVGWQAPDFLDGISEEACRGIREDNGWLLFLNSTEAMSIYNRFSGETIFEYMHAALDHYGIPPSKVIYECGNLLMPEYYERWCRERGIKPEVRFVPFEFFESAISRRMYTYPDRFATIGEVMSTQHQIRPKKFLSFNRVPHGHRVLAMSALFEAGLFEEGMVSFPGKLTKHMYENAIDGPVTFWESELAGVGYHAPGYLTLSKEFEEHEPFGVDRPPEELGSADITWAFAKWPYLASYLHVVIETRMEPDMLFLTEKTFKPIANYQPFVVIGSRGTYAHLEAMGYRLPDIDYSFDSIEDPMHRLYAGIAEIKRLLSMSHEEMHKWYWAQMNDLIHNRNLLYERVVERAHDLPKLMSKLTLGVEFDLRRK